MRDPSDRLSNLIGALALGIADRVRRASLDETGLGGEAAAALVVIGHAPGLSINILSGVLRLSHPGAVRVVDRLVEKGLAARTAAEHDRRSVTLTLTQSGRETRAALLERRRMVLDDLLSAVDPADRAVLERVAEAILPRLPSDAVSALNVCRLCDETRCLDCPMNIFGVFA
ncbi:MarR family transcriptional repressor of emrRAB [Sphingomonas sp. UYAg733]